MNATSKKVHMCMSIEGALKRVPNNYNDSFADHDSGRPMTNKELRAHLLKCKLEGKRVIPIGDCDNFDDQTGCKGHDVVLLVHDWEFEEGNG